MPCTKFFFLSACLFVALLLQGCITVATTSASAVYNHQSLQKSTQDQYLTLRSYQAIDIDSDQFKTANINVSTFNRVVLLSGQVPLAWQKTESEKLVRKVVGVRQVYNLLTVEKPVDQITRLHDTWITTKIKTKLLASLEIDATQVKVVTEKGTVFLMGVLQPGEAAVAINTASRTEGVQQVVKIFTYLNLSKTPLA